MFFCVRESLQAEAYLLGVIYEGLYHRRPSDDDREVILRLVGFYAGPLMIDEVLAYWAAPPRLSVGFRRLSQHDLAVGSSEAANEGVIDAKWAAC